MKNEAIDLVIPWVNGEDPAWQAKAKEYMPGKDFTGERFRDWGTLKFLFRSVDRYLPWINKIYLITDNQVPEWLNLNNEKVQVVDHRDFIPAKYLPSFNSNAILMNVHRIPKLAEHFLIMEDDMLFTRPAEPSDFFVDGKPRDFLVESPISPHEEFSYILMNTLILINQKYDKRKILKEMPTKYFNIKYGTALIRSFGSFFYRHFTGFYNRHCVQPYLKSVYKHVVEEMYPEECADTMSHRVRNRDDITEWIVRYVNLLNGNFVPSSPNRSAYFEIGNVDGIRKAVNEEKKVSICMNDTQVDDFSKTMHQITDILSDHFSGKSQFEK
ncbi:MAG TPA: Stealth CR1 domain-containing protein [Candidatus Ligilactobacillus excrementigallinarum]|uniref:Stealth CR1 domain-containing protein n=1 Tax=Candidatus Ligilactobacillus excrementigallinarum TaxID=2838641 RepID=A0A9D2A9Q7_9LACO|nr:Stealth CR1 domain-containing protein [Candidatus Ligilactobacillus excrementigallinarum]